MKPRCHLHRFRHDTLFGILAHVGCSLVLALSCVVPGLADSAEASAQNPASPANARPGSEAFVVFGKIIDSAGKPMEGVQVLAQCGMGSLFCTGKTETGANGDYRLSFGPGVRMGAALGVGPFGVGFQASTISARKPGYFLQGLGRAGNLAMTDSTNAAPNWSTNYAGIVRTFQPYHLDFTMLPASLIRGYLVDSSHRLSAKVSLCLVGHELPPSSSALACVDLGKSGEFQFTDVPVGYSWWFEVTLRQKDAWKTLRSEPITISEPDPRHIHLIAAEEALEIKR
jgi:hypothetical protein